MRGFFTYGFVIVLHTSQCAADDGTYITVLRIKRSPRALKSPQGTTPAG